MLGVKNWIEIIKIKKSELQEVGSYVAEMTQSETKKVVRRI